MKVHELKINPIFYEDISKGIKNFEIRFCRDRNFEIDDIIILREYSQGQYSDKPAIFRVIKYIYFGNEEYGLSSDYCILGLKER